MAEKQEVIEYIDKLPKNEAFKELTSEKQASYIFDATEMLKSYYSDNQDKATEKRLVAKQTLYLLEGDSEEFNRLKAHGITNATTKDTSVTFDKGAIGNLISPEVSAILEQSQSHGLYQGRVGRLI